VGGGFLKRYEPKRKFKREKTGGYARRLTPFADWASKTFTEARTGRPAKSPSIRVARGEWYKTFGQRVPTAEMLSRKKTAAKKTRTLKPVKMSFGRMKALKTKGFNNWFGRNKKK